MKVYYETLMNYLQEYGKKKPYVMDEDKIKDYRPSYVCISPGNRYCDSAKIQRAIFQRRDLEGTLGLELDVAFVYYNTKHKKFLVYAWTEDRLRFMLRDPLFYFELKLYNLYDEFIKMERLEMTDSFLEIIQLIICLDANVEKDFLEDVQARIESDFIRIYYREVESFLESVSDYKLSFLVFSKGEKMTLMKCIVRMPKTYFATPTSLIYPMVLEDSVASVKSNLFRRMS